MTEAPFWRTKTLEQMSQVEWESLCDGCGRCCLHKIREDDGSLSFTNVACRLLNPDTGLCRDYTNRRRRVPDCVQLTAREVRQIDWLPPSCAYRRLAEGRDLPSWHPLITGDPDSVARAGASVRGRVLTEREAGPFEHHVVNWPGRMPRRPRPDPEEKRNSP